MKLESYWIQLTNELIKRYKLPGLLTREKLRQNWAQMKLEESLILLGKAKKGRAPLFQMPDKQYKQLTLFEVQIVSLKEEELPMEFLGDFQFEDGSMGGIDAGLSALFPALDGI